MKLSLILSVIHNKIRDSYLQALKYQLSNGTSTDCANSLALQVVRLGCSSSNIPASISDLLVCWQVVPDHCQDKHDHMLCYAHNVTACKASVEWAMCHALEMQQLQMTGLLKCKIASVAK